MPQPNVYQVHIDRPLTNISVAYMQEQSHFIAPMAGPLIPSDKMSDKYYIYNQADWYRDEAQPVADAAETAGSGYTLSTDDFKCVVYGLHKDIGDQMVANSDNPLNPRGDAARFLTQKMLLKLEVNWIAKFFTTSLWGNDVTGGTNFTQWNNYATSDPIEDVELGKETILQDTGYMPNTLIMGYQVFRKLKHHPDIVDRLKYTRAVDNSTVSEELLAAMFGVDRVLVAKSVRNTAVENATDAYSFILGKHALLAHVAPAPGVFVPSACYTFMWTGVSQGLGANVGIKSFRLERNSAERLEVKMAWDFKLVASALGYFFSGAVV